MNNHPYLENFIQSLLKQFHISSFQFQDMAQILYVNFFAMSHCHLYQEDLFWSVFIFLPVHLFVFSITPKVMNGFN